METWTGTAVSARASLARAQEVVVDGNHGGEVLLDLLVVALRARQPAGNDMKCSAVAIAG